MGFKWGQELLKAKKIIRYLQKENDRLDFRCYDLEQENKALKQEIEVLKTKRI